MFVTMKSGFIMLFTAVLVAIDTSNQYASAELSCYNEKGEPVDWFIAYKFPKLDGDELFEAGEAYSYITSDDVKESESEEVLSLRKEEEELDPEKFLHKFKELLLKFIGYKRPKSKLIAKSATKKQAKKKIIAGDQAKWVASDMKISDPKSIIMRTMAVAYDKKASSVNSVYYNDDPTGTEDAIFEDRSQNTRRAHAKGVLLMDEKSGDGVWLTHSVPRFPTIRKDPLRFPESGHKNGQTFMCIGFDLLESGKKIVDHLVNMRPLVYDNKISAKMYTSIPDLKNLDLEDNIKRRRVAVVPKLAQTITTKGGQELQLFAKSISFDQDMYAGWIDKEIGSDLYVETWRNGAGGVLNSSCPKSDFRVNNVQDLKYDTNLQWSYLKDHSKWAISEEQEVGVVCIGDSNRMASQFKRGGGAVCIRCPTCWNIFSNTIQDVEPCPVGSGGGKGRRHERDQSSAGTKAKTNNSWRSTHHKRHSAARETSRLEINE